jgi:undecaprenyl diphosphate synthase
VARAPLIRPTDAPPQAHEIEAAAGAPAAGAPAAGAAPEGTATPAPSRPADAVAETELPRHVAIIMDGNRRWARARGAPEFDGHAAGVEAIRELLRHSVRRGIPVMTLYAFSRENWARTDAEVVGLFQLLEQAIRSETDELRAQGVQVRLLGRLDELPAATRTSIESALEATAGGTRMRLNIAFNYAGRTELVDAVRAIVRAGLDPEAIDEATIAGALYTAGLPDPDLVIRTGGEHRLSNFLIWQSAYAELITSDTLWPDFGPADLDEALAEFASRTRRFGR